MKGINSFGMVFSVIRKLLSINLLISLFVMILINIEVVITGDCKLEMMCASCDTENVSCLDCHSGYILDAKKHCQPVSWPMKCEKVDMFSSDSS